MVTSHNGGCLIKSFYTVQNSGPTTYLFLAENLQVNRSSCDMSETDFQKKFFRAVGGSTLKVFFENMFRSSHNALFTCKFSVKKDKLAKK